jgi:hypothetical protein
MHIEDRGTPNRIEGRAGDQPRAIVVHTTEGHAKGTISWFADPSSGVSAHYLVGLDGRVYRFVEEEDTARHTGPELNPSTIGVEFEDLGDPATSPRSEAQYEIGARLIRDIAYRWSIPLDRSHVVEHRSINPEKTCPGNLEVDRLLREALGLPTPIVCLLPARNAAKDLPGYFRSAAAFCDAVVALDDGSTDETSEMLERSPMVRVLLKNPPRDGYAGWDDGANRRRLLEAAATLGPEWILSIDADERMDDGDAAKLREFVDGDAVPGYAYGFQHFRMWQGRYDPRFTWIYRLFAYESGQEFPTDRLHFNPIPTSIPRNRWVRTTIRVQHLGATNQDMTRARLAKYREADPEGRYPTTHGGLGDAPTGELQEWRRRDPDGETLYTAPRARRRRMRLGRRRA